MDRTDKLKEYRWAMNGRIMLLMLGIMMIANALMTSVRNGAALLSMISDAKGGDEELQELIAGTGFDYSRLQLIAVCFLIVAAAELAAGIVCIVNCNRIDRSKITFIVLVVLLVIEVLSQLLFVLHGVTNLGTILTTLVIPAFLLWTTRGYRKLAALYPDRKYAAEPVKRGAARAQNTSQGPKKSLRERAMMPRETAAKEKAMEDSAKKQAEAKNVTPAWQIRQWEENAQDVSGGEAGEEDSQKENEPQE